jgi:hypothetical protein
VSGGFNNPLVGGGGALVYPAIYSPGFKPAAPLTSPTPSWGILKNGLAYFFGLTITGGSLVFPGGYVDATGMFTYNGTPGAGTLIQSTTPPSTTFDKYGNAIVGTNTTYQKISSVSWEAVAYQGNEVQFFTATSAAGPWVNTGQSIVFSTSGPQGIELNGAAGVGLVVGPASVKTSGSVPLLAQFGATVSNQALNATAGLAVTGGTTTDSETVTGQLTATGGTAGSPTLITTDGWHPLGALGAGSGYTVVQGRYQLTSDGRYEVDVNLTAGAATVAGVYAFANTLPSPPPDVRSYPLGYNGTVTAATNFPDLRIDTSGNVRVQLPVLPNTTVVSATQRVPTN